jgi:LacI family transcriptional regulator
VAPTPRKPPLRRTRPSGTSPSGGTARVAPGPRPSLGATIYSVAERAGVSIATVSRVLQGSTVVSEAARQKVLDAVDALHYVPVGAARSLAVRHHEAYGLVLPELTGPYYSELLMGFETRAAELGQSVVLLLANGKSDLPRSVGHLATRVDGIGVLGSAAMPPAVARALRGRKPVVIIAGAPSDAVGSLDGVELVAAENSHSAEQLTEHLFDHGSTQLLFVGDPGAAPDIRDRHAGFVAAHTARGLVPAEPVRVLFRESEGAAVADRVLSGELQADALVCANDELALAIMSRLQDAGRDVPRDIAVVGWDDVMTSRYVRPGMTTVRQPVHELGVFAAERLHQRVDGAQPLPDPVVLPTELVLRGSCGCSSP